MPRPHAEIGLLLSDTVRTLVVAWRSLAAYPPAHPAAIAALQHAHWRLAEVTTSHGPLTIGVSRNGLVFGETTFDSSYAQTLARALYEREVAILRIEQGVQASELESLLRLLARDPRQEEVSFWDRLTVAGTSHIQLQPVDYSAVRVTDEVRRGGERGSLQDRIVRALLARPQPAPAKGSLWDTVLRALLAGASRPVEAQDAAPPESLSGPDIAACIAEYLREAGAQRETGGSGDQGTETAGAEAGRSARLGAVVAAKLASAVRSHLAAARGVARVLAARQTAELVQALPQQMRETVLHAAVRALASDERAVDALHALSSPFAPDVILRSFRQLESQGTRLSHHALRLVQTLSAVAGAPPGSPAADSHPPPDSLLSELLALFRDEDIDRFNPEDHQALFDGLSIELPGLAPLTPGTPADLGERVDSLTDDALAEQSARTLLEMLGHHASRARSDAVLSRIDTLFRLFLTRGRLDQATKIAETMRALSDDAQLLPELQLAVQDCLRRMADMDALAALVASLSPWSASSVAAARRVVHELGSVAIRNLLLLLVDESRRSRRRGIFDLLVSLGPAVAPEAAEWLSDSRWYVVRNMIALLRIIEDRSSLPEIRRCSVHSDRRVRLEAIKSLITLDPHASADILEQAIHDPEPKVVEVAIALAGRYGTADTVEPLVRILVRWDLFGRQRQIRLKALRALGELGDPAALHRLRRFFRNWHLPIVALEERRAAFALLQSYPESARRPLVRKGLKSMDREIREICRRLAGPPAHSDPGEAARLPDPTGVPADDG